LHAAAVTLKDSSTGHIAVHFGGIDVGLPADPYWQSARGGSRVHGGSAVSAASPLASAITWLRLTALHTVGSGVRFLQRLNAVGGLARPARNLQPLRVSVRE
jgi:hypothetical protein